MHSYVSSPQGTYVLIPHKAPDAQIFTKSKAQHAVHAMVLPIPVSEFSFENLRSVNNENVFLNGSTVSRIFPNRKICADPDKVTDVHLSIQREAQHVGHSMLFPVRASQLPILKPRAFRFVNVFYETRKRI